MSRARLKGFAALVLLAAALMAAIIRPQGNPTHNRGTFKPAKGETLRGEVVGVSDGDTITVLQDSAQVKVRLFGVDCPESHQAFGAPAKQFTSERVFGQTVRVTVHDTDRYGRSVGEVFFPKDGGEGCLNAELVEAGLAWAYRHYSETYVPREEAAHAAKRGLWADEHPVPPWEFRKQNAESKE